MSDQEYIQVMSDYMDVPLLSSVVDLVEDACKTLANVDYDTMIGRGLSGALVIPILARTLGKHWAIVRKPKSTEDSHGYPNQLEGRIGQRWIFVDDFISSGETLRATCAVVNDNLQRHRNTYQNEFTSTLVGAYLYRMSEFTLTQHLGEIH